MTLTQLVQMIGRMLTQLDQELSDPDLPSSNPDWQQLYAMRVHLDSQQRQLVALDIQINNAAYDGLAKQLAAANVLFKQQIGDIAKVADVVSTVAQVAALLDQVLSLAAA